MMRTEAEKERRRKYAREKQREWRARNPELAKARTNAWRKTAQGKATIERWRQANKEYLSAQRRYYRGLPEPTRPKPANCECCGNAPNGGRGLHLDHSHVTGRFRGWLCKSCNQGIGFLGDGENDVLKALMYLRRFDIL